MTCVKLLCQDDKVWDHRGAPNPYPVTYASLAMRGSLLSTHRTARRFARGQGLWRRARTNRVDPALPSMEGKQERAAVIGPYIGYQMPDTASTQQRSAVRGCVGCP